MSRTGLPRPALAVLRSDPAQAARLLLPLVLLLLALPLTLTDLPPLLDYPNHLARMYVLLNHATHPAIAAIYDVHWQLVPNMGMDLVVPPLARLIPLRLAGRLYAAAALLLPVAGTVLLHRAVHPGRSAWPLLVAASIAYHGIFLAGFLNYLVGSGLALIAAAAWLRQRRPLPRLLIACVVSPIIFICHLFAWGFYGLLIASAALSNLRRQPPRATLAALALAGVPFVAPAACLLSDAAAIPSTDLMTNSWTQALGWKVLGILSPTLAYVNPLDTAALALLLLLILLPLVRGQLAIARQLAPACGVLAIAFIVLPFRSHGTAFVDTRIPILVAFVLIAMVQPQVLPRPLVAVYAVVSLARFALVAVAFAAHAADVTAFSAAVAPVEAGSRVAVVTAFFDPPRGPEPIGRRVLIAEDALMHLPGLLVIEREAFWPLLFSAAGKQPIVVRPPYRRLAMAEGWLVSWRELAAPTPEGLSMAPYLAAWRRDFDYVVCLYPDRLADPAALVPGGLQLIRRTSVAALYRVIRPG
jgi:hypothetical protein